jgi:hypothetical protein
MDAIDASVTSLEHEEPATGHHIVLAGQILCIFLPLVIWFAPLDLEPQTKHTFAIVAFMVVAWITQAVDYALAGFIGCFLFWALGIVRFPVAFSGFANDTAWFLFGALLIGAIATRSGVARRLAFTVMLRVGVTYPRILLGLIVTDFLLTFVVPSGIARVVIMAAIALGLVEAFDATRGSNVARGMFLIITYTANIFDKMIIAGAGSITARGLIEKVGDVEVLWSQWFLAFVEWVHPISGLPEIGFLVAQVGYSRLACPVASWRDNSSTACTLPRRATAARLRPAAPSPSRSAARRAPAAAALLPAARGRRPARRRRDPGKTADRCRQSTARCRAPRSISYALRRRAAGRGWEDRARCGRWLWQLL